MCVCVCECFLFFSSRGCPGGSGRPRGVSTQVAVIPIIERVYRLSFMFRPFSSFVIRVAHITEHNNNSNEAFENENNAAFENIRRGGVSSPGSGGGPAWSRPSLAGGRDIPAFLDASEVQGTVSHQYKLPAL